MSDRKNNNHDQGNDRQAGPGAEKALGQQTAIDVPIAEFGHDRFLGADDLEGVDVCNQGTLISIEGDSAAIACEHVLTQNPGAERIACGRRPLRVHGTRLPARRHPLPQ